MRLDLGTDDDYAVTVPLVYSGAVPAIGEPGLRLLLQSRPFLVRSSKPYGCQQRFDSGNCIEHVAASGRIGCDRTMIPPKAGRGLFIVTTIGPVRGTVRGRDVDDDSGYA